MKNWILSVLLVLNNKGFIYHDQYYQRHRSPKINDPINDQTISEIKSQEPLRCWQDPKSDLGQNITMVGRTIKRLLEKAIIREGEMNNFKEFFI